MATQGQVFGAPQVNGSTPLASAQVFVGNSSGLATAVAISGDITTTNAGVTAIGANKVANSQLATMATTTIKGQSVGGSGSPIDLTAAQAAAIIGSVGGALKSKRIEITRDLTAASGNVSYTGVGFQPTTCTGFGDAATSLSQYVTLIGMVDSAGSAANMTLVTAGVVYDNAAFLRFFDATGSSSQRASINSFDADGFTLSWTKTGTPTGTATITIVCYR